MSYTFAREPLGYPTSPHSAFMPSCCPFRAFLLRLGLEFRGNTVTSPGSFYEQFSCAVIWRTVRCIPIVISRAFIRAMSGYLAIMMCAFSLLSVRVFFLHISDILLCLSMNHRDKNAHNFLGGLKIIGLHVNRSHLLTQFEEFPIFSCRHGAIDRG